MAEPTSTRTVLRRAICQELHMPFMRRTNGESTVGASPTTTRVTDTALFVNEDGWNNHWWYSITRDEVRRIIDTQSATTEIVLEYPATLPVAGEKYEIHTVFNAHEIHGAINRALDDAFPAFFDYVTDESLVVKEDTLKYDISGLTSIPWRISKLFIERNDTRIMGTATSGAVGSVTDTTKTFTTVESGWKLSIYAGTGAGQLRIVSTAVGSVLSPTVAFSPAPDSTSKYAVWNPSEETSQWENILHVGFDAKEYPTYFYLGRPFPDSLGLRFRLEYSSRPSALTLEASTTVVPKEFIISKALSILFGQKVNDNRADRTRYANLEEYRRQLAEQYRANRAFNQPDITIWQNPKSLLSSSYGSSQENPF